MDIKQAKTKLATFLNGKELTFSVTEYINGEWVAQCNEIPAILTGGMGTNITNRDKLMRDVILTAAGVDPRYANEILNFAGYKEIRPSFLTSFSLYKADKINNEAEYELIA